MTLEYRQGEAILYSKNRNSAKARHHNDKCKHSNNDQNLIKTLLYSFVCKLKVNEQKALWFQ